MFHRPCLGTDSAYGPKGRLTHLESRRINGHFRAIKRDDKDEDDKFMIHDSLSRGTDQSYEQNRIQSLPFFSLTHNRGRKTHYTNDGVCQMFVANQEHRV